MKLIKTVCAGAAVGGMTSMGFIMLALLPERLDHVLWLPLVAAKTCEWLAGIADDGALTLFPAWTLAGCLVGASLATLIAGCLKCLRTVDNNHTEPSPAGDVTTRTAQED